MEKRKSLKELKQQYKHYQEMYEQATPEGQTQLRQQLHKLSQKIKRLQEKQQQRKLQHEPKKIVTSPLNWQHLAQIETSALLEWARGQTLLPEHFNNKPTGRFERWLGQGVELLNFGKQARIYDASPIESEPLVEQLRERFFREATSALLYYYPPGVGIGAHTDKPVFNPNVVLINLVDAPTDLFGDKPKIKFRYGKETKLLGDGAVIRFNASVPHGLPPVRIPRYSLSLRIIVPH